MTRPSVEAIQRAVAQHYGMRLDQLVSARRSRRFSQPRHIAMCLAVELRPDMSRFSIARLFKRDRSMVWHAEHAVAARLAAGDGAVADLQAIRQRLCKREAA